MNYKKYIKQKKFNKLFTNICSFAIYLSFIFYVVQMLEFVNVIDFKLPYTNLIIADKIYLKAILATLIGNRVLGFCYHGINLIIGILLGYSAVCAMLKNKLDYTFYCYISATIYIIDMILGVFEGEYILCIIHFVLALMSYFTSIAVKKMRNADKLMWGDN